MSSLLNMCVCHSLCCLKHIFLDNNSKARERSQRRKAIIWPLFARLSGSFLYYHHHHHHREREKEGATELMRRMRMMEMVCLCVNGHQWPPKCTLFAMLLKWLCCKRKRDREDICRLCNPKRDRVKSGDVVQSVRLRQSLRVSFDESRYRTELGREGEREREKRE